MGIADYLKATKVLEELDSPVNGKIQVIKSVAFGTYIKIGGLTQSGGVVYDVWKTTLKKILRHKDIEIRRCLILGLGAGSAAVLVRKYWQNAKITGIELDFIMVELGRKYLGLDKVGVEILQGDTLKVLTSHFSSPTSRFDLILVDMYVGDTVPEKFETDKFINKVRELLTKDGIAVFNRLYYGEKRPLAVKFLQKVEKEFSRVDVVYPEANVMFVCRK